VKANGLRLPATGTYLTQFVQVQRVFIPGCILMYKIEGKPILESALGGAFAEESRVQWSTEHLVPVANGK
jgi:hypothetical protein